MQFLITFVAMFLTDVLYSLWMRRAAEGSALAAAFYAGMLMLGSGIVTMKLIENRWNLLAACLGAFLGTLIAITLDA